MTKPVTWSHSGLKDFEGCARRYYEVKVLKNFPQQETEQMRYGTALHEAAELFVKEGKPLPKEFEFIKPTLDALMSKPGRTSSAALMIQSSQLKPSPRGTRMQRCSPDRCSLILTSRTKFSRGANKKSSGVTTITLAFDA